VFKAHKNKEQKEEIRCTDGDWFPMLHKMEKRIIKEVAAEERREKYKNRRAKLKRMCFKKEKVCYEDGEWFNMLHSIEDRALKEIKKEEKRNLKTAKKKECGNNINML